MDHLLDVVDCDEQFVSAATLSVEFFVFDHEEKFFFKSLVPHEAERDFLDFGLQQRSFLDLARGKDRVEAVLSNQLVLEYVKLFAYLFVLSAFLQQVESKRLDSLILTVHLVPKRLDLFLVAFFFVEVLVDAGVSVHELVLHPEHVLVDQLGFLLSLGDLLPKCEHLLLFLTEQKLLLSDHLVELFFPEERLVELVLQVLSHVHVLAQLLLLFLLLCVVHVQLLLQFSDLCR